MLRIDPPVRVNWWARNLGRRLSLAAGHEFRSQRRAVRPLGDGELTMAWRRRRKAGVDFLDRLVAITTRVELQPLEQ